MTFKDFFKNASQRIFIVGTNPLIPDLEESAEFFVDLLNLRRDLELCILYESDTENFNQALCVDTEAAKRRMSYYTLSVHRDRIAGRGKGGGFVSEIKDRTQSGMPNLVDRVSLWQANLRLPMNIIMSDERIWYCVTTSSLPEASDYKQAKKGSAVYTDLANYVEFLTDRDRGGIFLSKPGEELIQLYDKQKFPRGIFPRAAFYRTDFQRYSIWGFIFNREGELLLHQRSEHTKDNPLQWDKSIGGHVDLRDRSTSVTAKRELIEEMFLPEAEFTKYLRADLGDIVDFGDWNPGKRPERAFKAGFSGLDRADWILLRATDDEGDPLTVTRVSTRRLLDKKTGRYERARTIFMSDVYLLIAPPGYLDTEKQMKKLVSPAEETGAANDHKIISIENLADWIRREEESGKEKEVFTDDLLAINLDYRPLLERFAAFIKYLDV